MHGTYFDSYEDAPAVLSPSLDVFTAEAARQSFIGMVEDSLGPQVDEFGLPLPLPDARTDPEGWVHREAAIVRASFLVAEHLADTVARYRKAAA